MRREKIRGWKRRVQHVLEWQQRHQVLDQETLLKSGMTYARLRIDPWYRLERLDPPIWLRRKMLEAMVSVHNSWLADLQKMGKPYYLALWVFEDCFVQSEVVAALDANNDLDQYEKYFRDSEPHVTFPYTYQIPAVSGFAWQSRRHDYQMTVEDFEEWKQDPITRRETLREEKRIVRRYSHEDGTAMLDFNSGAVWVGQNKEMRWNGVRHET